MRTALTTAVVISGLGAPVLAAPLRAGHVDSDARWVAHLDLEAAGHSIIGKWVFQQARAESDDFEELQEILPGFTLEADGPIRGITVYGSAVDMEAHGGWDSFVGVVYGTGQLKEWDAHIARVIEAAEELGGIQMQVDGRSVRAIPVEDGVVYMTLASGSGGRHAMVFAFHPPRLGRALDVIGGERESARESSLMPKHGWRDGTIAYFAAEELTEFGELEEASRVLGQAKTIGMRVGEADGRFFAEAAIETDEPEKAAALAHIVQGFVALGTLAAAQQDGDPELRRLMRLASDLRFEASDSTFVASFSHDAGSVVELLEESAGDESWGDFEWDGDDW